MLCARLAAPQQEEQKPAAASASQALVLMPARLRVPLPCPELPELVLGCVKAVQEHASASQQVRGWQLHVQLLAPCVGVAAPMAN